ncbi:hypothetical protein N8I71_19215 [Roseibacterium sp. SDUM158016]|uniref:hypothetical protein n=1 Tax=Roseicyclus sediminis TaxID=2980997 RepID=UPI0021CFB348|nr:hypothetical protein [Roseibacterium sp. SDUM158016]MCU4654975.1 hypothetical protein [Roseibacterium sp. SDUM158016]
MGTEAMRIYQEFLDVTAAALLARDAEAFLARVFLPHVIVTDAGTFEVADAATARRHFFGFADALLSQGTDCYARIAKQAEFDGPDRIHGRHEAAITAGGKLVAPRFENETELRLRDGVWGSSRTRHHTRFVAWPDILPRTDNS